MPRLATESSSVRRPASPSTSRSTPPLAPDALNFDSDDARPRSAAVRTRWHSRSHRSPYGARPLGKWLPSAGADSSRAIVEEMTALLELFPDPIVADEEKEEEGPGEDQSVVEESGETDREDEADGEEADGGEGGGHEDAGEAWADGEEAGEAEADDDDDLELTSDLYAAGAPPPSAAAASSAADKKREKNKKKKAKARAKAKEKSKTATVPTPGSDPPQELLASMSRIAELVGTLNTEAGEGDERADGEGGDAALLRRMRDVVTDADGAAPTHPAQWRAEVLQSVRRMETMLGQMEKWQVQVAPGEIEALRQETARLEVRVRAVVDQRERDRAVVAEGDGGQHGRGGEGRVSQPRVGKGRADTPLRTITRRSTPLANVLLTSEKSYVSAQPY